MPELVYYEVTVTVKVMLAEVMLAAASGHADAVAEALKQVEVKPQAYRSAWIEKVEVERT